MQGNQRRAGRRIGSVRASATALLLTVTVAAGLSAAPAQAAATAKPEKQACTVGSTGGNIKTCLAIYGNGLHVTKAVASAQVRSSGRTIYVILTGPTGKDASMQPGYVGPGDTGKCIWYPSTSTVAPGQYDAKTFRQNPDGSYTLVGDAKVTLP